MYASFLAPPLFLTITHIFLAASGGQVRRTVRSRCDCADTVWTVRRTFRYLYDIVFLLTGQHGLNVRQRLVKIGLHAALHALLISICNGDQIRFAQEITDDGQTGWLPIFR